MSKKNTVFSGSTGNQTADIPKRTVTSDDIRQMEEQQPLADGGEDVSNASREPASLGQGGFGSIDEHSGTYAYSFPVHIPPSQNGAPSPRVSLVYNSKNSKAAGLVGAGWRLELGKISRVGRQGSSVDFKNNQGADDANDHFILELNGSSYTLVGVYQQTDSFRIKIEKACAVVKRFLSETENDPMSGEKVIDYWEVYLADGTKYRFGTPEKPGSKNGELLNKTWNLMEIENPYGQKVIYKYEPYHNAQNPAYKELDFFYPAGIQCGVTPDGFWDGEVEFEYTDLDVPDEEEGYHNLTPRYTGRSGFTCIMWRRLTKIRTLYRNEQGEFQVSRELAVDAVYKSKENVFWVNGIEEDAYKNGKIDESAKLPPHRFEYIFKGQHNPALMNKSTDPMGKVEDVSYDLAVRIDPEAQNMEGIYLVHTFTEKAGKESWTQTYHYLGGLFYRGFEEYRGHRWVKTIDNETNLSTETWYEQNGVHNGLVREQKSFDAGGRLITHMHNTWMALDYDGGRYMPFIGKKVEREYAEDGKTVLSTEIAQIPKKLDMVDMWEYAVDEYGNILEQLDIVYEGDSIDGKVKMEKKTNTVYKNIVQAGRRFIGLPADSREFVRNNPSEEWQLTEWVENSYNDKGRVTMSLFHYDRVDPSKVYKKTHEFHPYTGKSIRAYRFSGNDKTMVEETQYYEDGPYRFLPRSVEDAGGFVETTAAYDIQFRLPTFIIEKNGMEAHITYDGLGRPVEELFTVHNDSSRKDRGHGNKASVQYVYTMTPTERSIEIVNIYTGTKSNEYFDQLNRKYKSLNSGYQGKLIEETIEYDHKSRGPYRVSDPYYVGESVPGYDITEYNDPRLRETATISSNGRVIRITYDGFKQTTWEDVYERTDSGKVGKLLYTRLDEEITRDALDRIIKNSDGEQGQDTRYEAYAEYDIENRLIKVTDSLGVTLRTVDYGTRLDDKPVMITDASLGTAVMEYDELGHLVVSKQDFLGSLDRISEFAYDEMDRIIEQSDYDTVSSSRRVVRSEYDTAEYGIGLLSRQEVNETGPLGSYLKSEKYRYDDYGLVSAIDQNWDINWAAAGIEKKFNARTEYVYNGQKGGRIERIKQPDIEGISGGTIEYVYDDLSGLLVEVLCDGKSVWKAGTAGFTPNSEVKEVVLGNGIKVNYDYEAAGGLLIGCETRRESDILHKYRLGYDTSGNIRTRRIQTVFLDKHGKETLRRTESAYNYDHKNQLIGVGEDKKEQSYVYHPNGSRRQFVDNGAKTQYLYEDKGSPHRISQLTGAHERDLTYDKAGNLIEDNNGKSRSSRRFTWNVSNKLNNLEFLNVRQICTRQICFGYTGDHERTISFDSLRDCLVFHVDDYFEVEWYKKDGRQVCKTHVSNGARRVATFVQEPGQPIKWYYYHCDYLNSTALVTGRDARVVCAVHYEPFGRVAEESGNFHNDRLFTGQRADVVNHEGFSLYDYNARFYDPDLGIFISPDPKIDEKNIAVGLNRYLYVGNNPLCNVDPDGTESNPLIVGPGGSKDKYAEIVKYVAGELGLDYHTTTTFKEVENLLKEGKNPIFNEHGYFMAEGGRWKKLGQWSSDAGNETLTAHVCGGSSQKSGFRAGVKEAMKTNPNATNPKFYSPKGKAGVDCDGFYHTKVPGTENPKRQVLLERRLNKKSPYIRKPLPTRKPPVKSVTYSKMKSTGKSAKKILKGVGGTALKGFGVAMRVKEGLDFVEDLKNGRVEKAGKTVVSTVVSSTIGSSVPILGPIAFEAGYAAGTAIHKATGGYIANKVADALISVGAHKVYNKVSSWFKSLW